MGKLLGHQIRNHFRNNWFIPVLPVALILFGVLFSNVNHSVGVNSVALGMMALMFGYFAAAITVIVGDYNMFFGDSALFYESTPISPSAKTFSRFLYYLIMFIIYSIYVGLICFLFMFVPSVDGGVIYITWADINELINEVGIRNILVLIAWCLLFLFNNIISIIFSVTLGGGKKLRRFGFGGPVLVYIGLGIIEGAVLYGLDKLDLFTNIELFLNNGDVFMRGMGIGILIPMLLETIALFCAVYYMHKSRISVN
ncbi:hypothetical protein HMPREF3023_03600 [Peptoniphilus sp. HMSC075B08]|uniref:hypothetical protein n=1 Tax=Peptoniphilus sp. HMSC075B08 TaxID=1739525 RepID=UPI0008A50122|nr:hypothetical protein [Peptoniphilus sp. HMSC075B08]OFO60617.1 hypothetical protein HMPREF3023_03600 [Peptoniphilus sp. HMSC075B08]